MRGIRYARRVFGKTAPYLLLEIVLPGGTLFALALFLYQQRDSQRTRQYARRLRRAWRRVAAKAGSMVDAAYSLSGLRAVVVARTVV